MLTSWLSLHITDACGSSPDISTHSTYISLITSELAFVIVPPPRLATTRPEASYQLTDSRASTEARLGPSLNDFVGTVQLTVHELTF